MSDFSKTKRSTFSSPLPVSAQIRPVWLHLFSLSTFRPLQQTLAGLLFCEMCLLGYVLVDVASDYCRSNSGRGRRGRVLQCPGRKLLLLGLLMGI